MKSNLAAAIYLCKRLMRNEKTHGLEPYEAEAYNRKLVLWGHMWEYISVQAEMQVRLHKERKKSDKYVFDSQERAYWRLFRPPNVCPIVNHYGNIYSFVAERAEPGRFIHKNGNNYAQEDGHALSPGDRTDEGTVKNEKVYCRRQVD
jgi:hypothetical protein